MGMGKNSKRHSATGDAPARRGCLTFEQRAMVFDLIEDAAVLDGELVQRAVTKIGCHPDTVYRLKTALDIVRAPDFSMPGNKAEFETSYGCKTGVSRYKVTRRTLETTRRDYERWRKEKPERCPGPAGTRVAELPPTAHETRVLSAALQAGNGTTGGLTVLAPDREALEIFKRHEHALREIASDRPADPIPLPLPEEPPQWQRGDQWEELADHAPSLPLWGALDVWREAVLSYRLHLRQMLLAMTAQTQAEGVPYAVTIDHPTESGFNLWAFTDLIDLINHRHYGLEPYMGGVAQAPRDEYRYGQGIQSAPGGLEWGYGPRLRTIAGGKATLIERARRVHMSLVERWQDSSDALMLAEKYAAALDAMWMAKRAFAETTLNDLRYGACRTCTKPDGQKPAPVAVAGEFLAQLGHENPIEWLASGHASYGVGQVSISEAAAGVVAPNLRALLGGRQAAWFRLKWLCEDVQALKKRFERVTQCSHGIVRRRTAEIVRPGDPAVAAADYGWEILEEWCRSHLDLASGGLSPGDCTYEVSNTAGEGSILIWRIQGRTRRLASGQRDAMKQLMTVHQRLVESYCNANELAQIAARWASLRRRRGNVMWSLGFVEANDDPAVDLLGGPLG